MVNDLLANKDSYLDMDCPICGKKLTQFGNRQCKDGLICRTCAKLSSRWLTEEDFENRTIEDIIKHHAYRKENLKKLDDFGVSKEVEGKYKLMIDRPNKQFLFSKRKDFLKENPDIIPFDDIEEISIVEENYFGEEGKDIYFEIKLNHPELNTIRFRINDFPGLIEDSEEYKNTKDLAFNYLNGLIDEEDIVVVDVLESEVDQ